MRVQPPGHWTSTSSATVACPPEPVSLPAKTAVLSTDPGQQLANGPTVTVYVNVFGWSSTHTVPRTPTCESDTPTHSSTSMVSAASGSLSVNPVDATVTEYVTVVLWPGCSVTVGWLTV